MDDCSSKQIKSTCPAELSDGYCGKLEVKDESGVTQSFSKGNTFPQFVKPQPGMVNRLSKAQYLPHCCF